MTRIKEREKERVHLSFCSNKVTFVPFLKEKISIFTEKINIQQGLSFRSWKSDTSERVYSKPLLLVHSSPSSAAAAAADVLFISFPFSFFVVEEKNQFVFNICFFILEIKLTGLCLLQLDGNKKDLKSEKKKKKKNQKTERNFHFFGEDNFRFPNYYTTATGFSARIWLGFLELIVLWSNRSLIIHQTSAPPCCLARAHT